MKRFGLKTVLASLLLAMLPAVVIASPVDFNGAKYLDVTGASVEVNGYFGGAGSKITPYYNNIDGASVWGTLWTRTGSRTWKDLVSGNDVPDIIPTSTDDFAWTITAMDSPGKKATLGIKLSLDANSTYDLGIIHWTHFDYTAKGLRVSTNSDVIWGDESSFTLLTGNQTQLNDGTEVTNTNLARTATSKQYLTHSEFSITTDSTGEFTLYVAGPISGSTANISKGIFEGVTYAKTGEAPEPATMALLAAGGIALLRRKRRKA